MCYRIVKIQILKNERDEAFVGHYVLEEAKREEWSLKSKLADGTPYLEQIVSKIKNLQDLCLLGKALIAPTLRIVAEVSGAFL